MFKKLSNISSFDIETTGLNPYKGAEIFSYSIGWFIEDQIKTEVRRLDTGHKKENLKYLQEYFKDKSIIKIAHNFKFELSFLDVYGIDIDFTKWEDTMILSQIFRNNAQSHSLDFLSWELAGISRKLDLQVKKEAKKVNNNYQKINKKLMTAYQREDAKRPILLYLFMFPEVKKDKKQLEAYKREVEFVKVTQQIEKNGLKIDKIKIDKMINYYKDELQKVKEYIKLRFKKDINLNSGKQLSTLLYDNLGFEILRYTDKGNPAVDKDILLYFREKSKDKIFDMVLKSRTYKNAISIMNSYKNFSGENDIIHPNINTNRAKTGRQSSSNPNLQNVSKESALKNLFPVPLRKCFITKPGNVLIFIDFSGIEMRLIIEATKEPELYKMLLNNPDADLHYPTVECFLGKKQAENLKESDPKEFKLQRSAFKNTGFCVSYGGGLQKVSETLGKSVSEIEEGYNNYISRFKKIAGFSNSLSEEVKEKGFIRTQLGRKLFIPSSKAYIASNYLIQGTASEILKIAQIQVQEYIIKNKLDIEMLLPIHDEIVFSYPRKLLSCKEEILSEIGEKMTNIKGIAVPLRVEYEISSTNWNNVKDLKI